MAYGKNINQVLYGGDYNPEQWPEETWAEDMRIMKKAHINIVTLNVFSWASLQPDENTYSLERLDKIMNLVRANGLNVCMATSTGAHPAWMAKRHPDILRTEANGMKRKFGGRHNSCPNSPTYRNYAPKLAAELAKRYQDYDNITAWHISNEYGGECYCDNCEKAFQSWLKKKYQTLDEVNRVFYTSFWGHTFYQWDEIVLPDLRSEHFDGERTMFQGISLDYRRFNSDSLLDCFKLEYDAIRQVIPDVPITTNLMGFYKPLDYQKWGKAMDFISWDSYPSPNDDAAVMAMAHDLMRGMKGQESFVLMEQTPSVTNWQPYNRLKRPGEMRRTSYQAVAHGADAIQFFQIRRSIGACEKFHGAVIDHGGRDDTRVFREIETLGSELKSLGNAFLNGRTPSETAILFDWDNWWAVEYSAGPNIHMKYIDAVKDYYRAAFIQNIPIDFISAEQELKDYKTVIAPLLYLLKPGYDKKIRAFLEQGGTFITTYFSGIVDEHDLVFDGGYPGKLRDILGIRVEENDALPKGEQNSFTYQGIEYPAELLCDLMHLEGADSISEYGADFYQGTPVITKNHLGKGTAYYVGTKSSPEFYQAFLADIFKETDIRPTMKTPEGVEAAVRDNENGKVLFLLNHSKKAHEIIVDQPWHNLLTGEKYHQGSKIIIEKEDVIILQQ